MTPIEETLADYGGAGMTTGPHLVAHLRAGLDARGVVPIARLEEMRDGATIRIGGVVVVRQKPGTARGFLFVALEDESGMCQAIVRPDLVREHRALVVGAPALVVEGIVQKREGTLSVKAQRFWPLEDVSPDAPAPNERFEPELAERLDVVPSHDFR